MPFGPDLLPGMYSPPVHTIPKPSSEKLGMVVDHSAEKYSLNSMINPKDIAGVKLDGINSLGISLRTFRADNPNTKLFIFKSDVGAAYRQMPMHFLYQLFTIITVDNERRVDRCNNFGNRGSQKIWQSFMSLVMWILVFQRGLKHLKCYTDDIFSFLADGNLASIPPTIAGCPPNRSPSYSYGTRSDYHMRTPNKSRVQLSLALGSTSTRTSWPLMSIPECGLPSMPYMQK